MFNINFNWPFWTKNSSTQSNDTVEPDNTPTSDDTDSSTGINRPPGWEPLYNSFEKPVYPIDDRTLKALLNNVSDGAEWSTVHRTIPITGTNDEHIKLNLYTVQGTDARVFVTDVEIHNFSDWTPEEKGGYEYPEQSLQMNGPYYMKLNNNLTDELGFAPYSFTLDEYDEAEDIAFFSAEKEVHQLYDE